MSNTDNPDAKHLNPNSLRDLLDDIGRHLAKENRIAEIALFGGSALMLMYDFRESTLDADYMMIGGNDADVRLAAEIVAKDKNLPEDWFNDAVNVFVSDNHDVRFFGDFPRDGEKGLRVFNAAPEYIFAMKILAMRTSIETHDIRDIWSLIDVIELKTVEDAVDLLRDFYPKKELPRRNKLILKDIFEAKAHNEDYSAELGW